MPGIADVGRPDLFGDGAVGVRNRQLVLHLRVLAHQTRDRS